MLYLIWTLTKVIVLKTLVVVFVSLFLSEGYCSVNSTKIKLSNQTSYNQSGDTTELFKMRLAKEILKDVKRTSELRDQLKFSRDSRGFAQNEFLFDRLEAYSESLNKTE